MSKIKKDFQSAGYTLLILLVIGTVGLISNIVRGQYSFITYPDATIQNITNIIITITLALNVSALLLKLLLVLKAFAETAYPTKSRMHIVFAWIMEVINIIIAIILITSLFSGEDILDNVGALLSVIADILVISLYIHCAKKLLNEVIK